MRLGIDGRKIPKSRQRGGVGSLEHGHALGMDGLFFRTVLDVAPSLDPGVLRAIRQRADELGMYLEMGLGKVNPYALPETPEVRAVGDGDTVLAFRRMMEACAAIDCRELWVGTANYKSIYPGRYAIDRFRTDVDWSDQLVAIERFLRKLGRSRRTSASTSTSRRTRRSPASRWFAWWRRSAPTPSASFSTPRTACSGWSTRARGRARGALRAADALQGSRHALRRRRRAHPEPRLRRRASSTLPRS